MSDDRMQQMSEVIPSFEAGLALHREINDVRREWSGILMREFPQRAWMHRRAKRLAKKLNTGSVEFNAICEGQQTTICSSLTTVPRSVPQTSSLCVITVSIGGPLAVNDVHTAEVTHNHPAGQVCRSWASYPVMVNGTAAGTVCAIDSPEPREWTRRDQKALERAATDIGRRIATWLATR